MSNFFFRNDVNVDTGHLCDLECPRCQRWTRYRKYHKKVPGRNLSMDEWNKITDHFGSILMCGQFSDPVLHPQIHNILSMCFNKRNEVRVFTASSVKSREWYIEAFKSNPLARWVFSIDGLPELSSLYRINQDGEKLFDIMVMSKEYLRYKPIWSYIIFKYNQDYINEAMEMAANNGVVLKLVNSSRWIRNDPLRPDDEYALNAKTRP